MKMLIVCVLALTFSQAAQAKRICFVFEMSGKAKGWKSFEVRLPQKLSSKDASIGEVKGVHTKGSQASGTYACLEKESKEIFCYRDDDGGDFTLVKGANGAAELSFIAFDLGDPEVGNDLVKGPQQDQTTAVKGAHKECP